MAYDRLRISPAYLSVLASEEARTSPLLSGVCMAEKQSSVKQPTITPPILLPCSMIVFAT